MKQKIVASILSLVLLLPMFSALPFTIAATEEEIEESIIHGLEWLASQQNEDGSWGDWDRVGHTGLAVLKFASRARELDEDPLDPGYEYYDQVRNGLDFLLNNTWILNITVQPAGDPDTNGNGIGAYFNDIYDWGEDIYRRTYSTGIGLMAVSEATRDHPGWTVDVEGSSVDGWSYGGVVQETVDYLAFGQNEGDYGRGGWGYYENYGWYEDGTWYSWSDNSNSGYVVLGLGYAEGYGATVPQFVKDELSVWIDYIQNDPGTDDDGLMDDPDGGSGYSTPDDWVNMLKTGNLLYQMRFFTDPLDAQRVTDAISYQERHWEDDNPDPGWRNFNGHPHYQAAYCIMKGFEAYRKETITVDDTDIDWFDEMSTEIVESQNEDGSWPYDYWGDEILATAWALLTLEKVIEIPKIIIHVDIKPGSWPNPINKGSRGKFAVAICGTDELDVTTIDPASVRIHAEGVEEGVPPLRWAYEDAATPYTGDPGGGHELTGDGYTDLVLHFDTQEVVDTLELCVYDDETVPLIVRGNLHEEHGGTAFEGQDYVWLKAPKGKGKG
ncbi:MAG: hypothetical protein NWF12_05610 [Candidatus Bathyarchaeota archaeon]|nr:hypothetical protein [Candidatus Bathyarchaeota archaeon]